MRHFSLEFTHSQFFLRSFKNICYQCLHLLFYKRVRIWEDVFNDQKAFNGSTKLHQPSLKRECCLLSYTLANMMRALCFLLRCLIQFQVTTNEILTCQECTGHQDYPRLSANWLQLMDQYKQEYKHVFQISVKHILSVIWYWRCITFLFSDLWVIICSEFPMFVLARPFVLRIQQCSN